MPAKWFIRKLASYLTETDIPDLNSGLRAFRRDVAMQYVHQLPAGFSCVTTLTMSFLANGYSVKYVPIDYSPRAGKSKFHWWRDTKRYLLQVVRMTLSYNPLKVFLPLGADAAAARPGQARLRLGRQGLPVATNTLLILFAALQAITVGLLADLVVRATKPPTQVPPVVTALDRHAVRHAHGQHLRQVRVDEPDRAADDARVHGRPGRHARRAGTTPDPGGRRRRGSRDARGSASASRACPLVGLDLPVRFARRRLGRAGLPCLFGDATALPFPDDAFDLVLAIEVLEHVPGPEPALAELARVCSGTLVASVPFEPIWRAGNLARRRYVARLGQHAGPRQPLDPLGLPPLRRRPLRRRRGPQPLPWTILRATTR